MKWIQNHSTLKWWYKASNWNIWFVIKKNEMGRACSVYGGGEKCVQGFGGDTWGKETTGETQA